MLEIRVKILVTSLISSYEQRFSVKYYIFLQTGNRLKSIEIFTVFITTENKRKKNKLFAKNITSFKFSIYDIKSIKV